MYRIEITGSLKGLAWSSGHYVPDNDKCRHFHGHDYSLDIIIDAGDVESTGMVIDFTLLKKIIKPIINEMDHKFMIPESDAVESRRDGMIDIVVRNVYKGTMPEDDVFILPYPADTAEYIAKYCYKEIYRKLYAVIRKFKMEIVIHEGPGNMASYTE